MKRRLKNSVGGPAGWKNMGPLPHVFPPAPRATFLGRLFFPGVGIAVKKMGKNNWLGY
jgi:hypothetical protein